MTTAAITSGVEDVLADLAARERTLLDELALATSALADAERNLQQLTAGRMLPSLSTDNDRLLAPRRAKIAEARESVANLERDLLKVRTVRTMIEEQRVDNARVAELWPTFVKKLEALIAAMRAAQSAYRDLLAVTSELDGLANRHFSIDQRIGIACSLQPQPHPASRVSGVVEPLRSVFGPNPGGFTSIEELEKDARQLRA